MRKLLWGMMVLGLLTAFISDKGRCQRPLPWHIAHCLEMEQNILNATVRILFHGSIEIDDRYDVIQINGTLSHATVINGRYLLTHNHFGIPLSQIQAYNRHANKSFTGISIYRVNGTAVLNHAPLDVFTIAAEKGETVLLDFGTQAGEGFFTNADVASAPVAGSESVRLMPNTEVALIDWDQQGETRVVWAPVQAVYDESGLTLLRIDHFIELGASGGGVFLNGQHIGNNWSRITETSVETGAIRQQITLAALNAEI